MFMPDTTRIREQLKTFDFSKLFIEELGWDRHSHLDVPVDGQTFALSAVAQREGWSPTFVTVGGRFAARLCDRRKVERQVSKSVLEHLIVYVDKEKTAQVWQWVKREPGNQRPSRTHVSPDSIRRSLIQSFKRSPSAARETLSLVDVTRRTRKAFDVERVTKPSRRIPKHHAAFQIHHGHSQGGPGVVRLRDVEPPHVHLLYPAKGLSRRRSRLFAQSADPHQAGVRQDKFYSFYRYFPPPFHEG
jgi:hypothetical protein